MGFSIIILDMLSPIHTQPSLIHSSIRYSLTCNWCNGQSLLLHSIQEQEINKHLHLPVASSSAILDSWIFILWVIMQYYHSYFSHWLSVAYPGGSYGLLGCLILYQVLPYFFTLQDIPRTWTWSPGILYFPCIGPGVNHFSKETRFLSLNNGV